MEQFKGYVDPELAQFLNYDGEDFSDLIGDEWKEVELQENEEGVYV